MTTLIVVVERSTRRQFVERKPLSKTTAEPIHLPKTFNKLFYYLAGLSGVFESLCFLGD